MEQKKASRGQIRLSVGHMAELFDLDPQTLRFYDKKGYFHPAGRIGNDYRYYLAQQIPQLYAFLALKQTGLGLADVHDMLSSSNLERNLDRWANHEKKVETEIRKLTMQQKGIHRFRTLAEEGIKRVGELSFVNQQQISFVPIAHFDITEAQDSPHFHPEIGKRLLSTLEKGEVSFPSFGASVSLDRLLSNSFDPPNTLFISWESTELKNTTVPFHLNFYPQSYCASLFFEGTYELLPKAYQTLLSFIRNNNMKPCGDSLEINHLDAFSVSDSDRFITRVLIPVESIIASTV